MKTTQLAATALILAASLASAQWVETYIITEFTDYRVLLHSPASDVIYAAATGPRGRVLLVVDCETNVVVDSHRFTSGQVPRAGVVVPTVNKLYLTLSGALELDTMAVFDASSHELLSVMHMPNASDVVWDPARDLLYVGTLMGASVRVLDCESDSVVGEFAVQSQGFLYLNREYDKLYSLDYASGSVSVIDLATGLVTATIAVGNNLVRGVYCDSVAKFYCTGPDELVVIDGASDSIVARVPHDGGTVQSFAVNARGDRMAFANRSTANANVFFVDVATDSIVATVPLGGGEAVKTMFWSGLTELLYCASEDSNLVRVLSGDGSGVHTRLEIGGDPDLLAYSPQHARLYVAGNDPVIYVVRDALSGVAGQGPLPALAPARPIVMRAPELVWFEGRVLDVTGREVTEKRARISPGIYFLLQREGQSVTKLVVTR